jgi:hypothetical protein
VTLIPGFVASRADLIDGILDVIRGLP